MLNKNKQISVNPFTEYEYTLFEQSLRVDKESSAASPGQD